MSDYTKKLASLKKKWAAAREEAKTSPFSTVEDGRYIARLTGSKIGESSKGNLGLTTEFTIVQGEETGTRLTRWDGLERDEGLPYVARHLKALGLEIDELDLENVEEQMGERVKERPAFRIRVKTNGDFQNIYVDKEVDVEDDVEEEDAGKAKPKKKDAKKPKEEEEDSSDDDEGETPELEVGAAVAVEHDGKEKEGEIVSIDEKKGTCMVKLPRIPKPVKFEFDDLTLLVEDDAEPAAEEDEASEDEDEDKPDPEKGNTVVILHEGREKEGKVVSVDKKKKTCEVEIPRVKKPVRYAFADVEVLVDAE